MTDVWNFLTTSFPILPEREAHALVGPSMGGSAAFEGRGPARTASAVKPNAVVLTSAADAAR